MFGLTEYVAAGAVILAVGWGGVQQARMQAMKLERNAAMVETSKALGALATCDARLKNKEEAAASNASIPDDLSDFDNPWLLPESGADPATD